MSGYLDKGCDACQRYISMCERQGEGQLKLVAVLLIPDVQVATCLRTIQLKDFPLVLLAISHVSGVF
ncbi:hypothetical protein RYB01_22240 [Pseudomonas syringae]|nr:hypothetical protein [Pseudomonas syringae]